MRRFLSFLLILVMSVSLFAMAASAAGESAFRPDLVVSKASPNPAGKDTNEAIELVNTSGRDLNLYEYSMFYNGRAKTHENFGKVERLTPFKPGDYRDGTDYTYGNLPTNPSEFIMKPGEVVVVRMINKDTVEYEPLATEADFRAFWNIPESVRIINFDSYPIDNGNTNFQLGNSGTPTYGIVKNSLPPVINETTYEQTESYCTFAFDESASIDGGILVYGFDGTAQMKQLNYAIEGIQFGVLTDEQKASFGDLLNAIPPEILDETPKTGDNSMVELAITGSLAFASLALGAWCLTRGLKKGKNEVI